jgi:hypothetical protein
MTKYEGFAGMTASRNLPCVEFNVFRFSREEIEVLIHHFDLESIVFSNRIRSAGRAEMALCLVLARLSWPHRFDEFPPLFGRSMSTLKRIFNDTLLYLQKRYHPIIEWHPMINYNRMKIYSYAIDREGGGNNIWGFVDGTFKPCCRPGDNDEQRIHYSGYKKTHGMKFQGLCSPDGLILSLTGPYEGRMNDFQMMRSSGIEEHLDKVSGISFN